VPVCFFIAAWSYALCVNFVPYYRVPADAIGESSIGLRRDEDTREDEEVASTVVEGEGGDAGTDMGGELLED